MFIFKHFILVKKIYWEYYGSSVFSPTVLHDRRRECTVASPGSSKDGNDPNTRRLPYSLSPTARQMIRGEQKAIGW